MAEITNLKELVPGKEYNIFLKPLDVTNRCRFICGDTTVLKRNISYWAFSDRGQRSDFTKNDLRIMFDKDDVPHNIFALWDFDLKNNVITEINTNEKV